PSSSSRSYSVLNLSPPLSSSCSCPSSCPLSYLPSFPTRRSSDLSLVCLVLLLVLCLVVYAIRFSLEKSFEDKGSSFECGFQPFRSEEHTSELQSRFEFVFRLLLDKKK